MASKKSSKTARPLSGGCDVFVGTRITIPAVPFCDIVHAIVPRQFTVSVALLGDSRTRALNKQFRKKSYVPDVLSFNTAKDHGEIILNPRRIRAQAKQYGHTFRTHLIFLTIHAALHLKGFEHGKEMEKLEQKYLARFS